MEKTGNNQIEHDEGCADEDHEGETGVLPDPDNVQARHPPNNAQYQKHGGRWSEGEKGSGVRHGADGRYTSSQDVIHHDRRDGDKGDHRPQNQIGEGIDPATDEIVVLEDLGNLGEPGTDETNQDAGNG